MQLYQPQVQLIKRPNMDGPDEYWLHAVTFCHKTYYRAAGHAPLPDDVDDDGNYHIELRIAQDIDLPEMELITPVVHTLFLGNLPFPDGEGLLEISVVANVRGNSLPAASTTVSSSSANEEKEKPILADL